MGNSQSADDRRNQHGLGKNERQGRRPGNSLGSLSMDSDSDGAGSSSQAASSGSSPGSKEKSPHYELPNPPQESSDENYRQLTHFVFGKPEMRYLRRIQSVIMKQMGEPKDSERALAKAVTEGLLTPKLKESLERAQVRLAAGDATPDEFIELISDLKWLSHTSFVSFSQEQEGGPSALGTERFLSQSYLGPLRKVEQIKLERERRQAREAIAIYSNQLLLLLLKKAQDKLEGNEGKQSIWERVKKPFAVLSGIFVLAFGAFETIDGVAALLGSFGMVGGPIFATILAVGTVIGLLSFASFELLQYLKDLGIYVNLNLSESRPRLIREISALESKMMRQVKLKRWEVTPDSHHGIGRRFFIDLGSHLYLKLERDLYEFNKFHKDVYEEFHPKGGVKRKQRRLNSSYLSELGMDLYNPPPKESFFSRVILSNTGKKIITGIVTALVLAVEAGGGYFVGVSCAAIFGLTSPAFPIVFGAIGALGVMFLMAIIIPSGFRKILDSISVSRKEVLDKLEKQKDDLRSDLRDLKAAELADETSLKDDIDDVIGNIERKRYGEDLGQVRAVAPHLDKDSVSSLIVELPSELLNMTSDIKMATDSTRLREHLQRYRESIIGLSQGLAAEDAPILETRSSSEKWSDATSPDVSALQPYSRRGAPSWEASVWGETPASKPRFYPATSASVNRQHTLAVVPAVPQSTKPPSYSPHFSYGPVATQVDSFCESLSNSNEGLSESSGEFCTV